MHDLQEAADNHDVLVPVTGRAKLVMNAARKPLPGRQKKGCPDAR
jgi:hypothetical protein